MEWHMGLDLKVMGYAQLSLVDDRIVIHKPVNLGVENKSRKVSDTSYTRRCDFIGGVLLPVQLVKALGIKTGDKVDVTLEENCVTVRKHLEEEAQLSESEPPDSIMAFCCVCGSLLYTENGLVKVKSKYICHECVDTVKSL